MKDSDIIKALECCKSAVATDCKGCPLYNTEKNCTCVTVLSENALALINRRDVSNAKSEAITEYMEEVERRCIKSGLYPVIIKNILHNIKEEMV